MDKDILSQRGQFGEILFIIDSARSRALKAVNAEFIKMYWDVE